MTADQRRIVVTGASRGLGRALTEQFARLGHVVFGCSRSDDAVAELSQRFPPPHGFAVVDVACDEQVAAWADRVLAGAGPPDLLINNAALINGNAPLWEVAADEFSRVIDVNIKGVHHVVRRFAPAMIERGSGVIVNVSSTWGRSTAPDAGPYCATKWAVEGLTRTLAEELPSGVAAVPVNPGVIHTDMLETCFGAAASGYPTPRQWARRAAPFLLQLGPRDSGRPMTVPG